MVTQPQDEPLVMTEAEYLEFEEASEIRHEFVNGRVYAMTGASYNHAVITGNTHTSFNIQLAERDCTVISNEVRLKVDSKSVSFRYPDVMVVCGEPKFVKKRTDTIKNPTVIVEVLSPSTALVDHNVKLREYTQIASLQVYILIAQHEANVQVYTRQDAEKWTYQTATGLDSTIDLPAIGCTLALADVYKKVDLTSDDAG